MPPLSNKAPLGGTTGGNDLHRSGTLRVAVLIDLEWHAVAGGPRILRAETAALAAIACFQAVAGDWQQAPRFNNGYFFNARK